MIFLMSTIILVGILFVSCGIGAIFFLIHNHWVKNKGRGSWPVFWSILIACSVILIIYSYTTENITNDIYGTIQRLYTVATAPAIGSFFGMFALFKKSTTQQGAPNEKISEEISEEIYAGFRKRLGAGILDLLIIIPLKAILAFLPSRFPSIAIVTVILSSLILPVYITYFHYKFGATLGKMAKGIKVTLPNRNSIGVKQALLRSSVDIGVAFIAVIVLFSVETDLTELGKHSVPVLPAWFGVINIWGRLWYWSEFITLLFNKRKRAIHDLIAGTVVIYKEHAEQGILQEPAI